VVAWFAGPSYRLLIGFVALLFAPGYVLERLLPGDAPLPMLVRPALWLSLSISLVVLLYEWATVVGLSLTMPLLAGLFGLCCIAALVLLWRAAAPAANQPGGNLATPGSHLRSYGVWYAFGGIFALTLLTRFLQIEGLALPVWVDSVHHALMIRVAAEQGQAPYSLRPYLLVDNLPYHWGYHVVVATAMRLADAPLAHTMLLTGQLLNALHVLTCAALAAYVWRRPYAGVIAALVVGLLSIMPAYYVSWGRYTQLAGLLLLPPLAIAWHAGLRQPTPRWLVLVVLLLSGLTLVHMRVLIFALCLMAAMAVLWAIQLHPAPWAAIRARLGYVTLAAVAALLLSLPWLWTMIVQIVLPAIEQPQNLLGRENYNTFRESLLWSGHTRMLVALALLAALWGLFRRSSAVVLMVGWVAGLLVMANPHLLRFILPAVGTLLAAQAVLQKQPLLLVAGCMALLVPWLTTFPQFWLINNESVIISLFLPIGVLIGGGICLLWDWISRHSDLRWRMPLLNGLRAALVVLALWGTWDSRSVINYSDTVITSPADVAAIEWAASNTPADARFLVNATGWQTLADRGSDGGWWLLPLAGRWVSTPPVLYAYGAPDYAQQIRERSNMVASYQAGQEEHIYQLIEQAHITHIYLGSESGPLTMDLFAGSDRFEKVYEHHGIIILAVNRQT
jgi:hypothetical protein